MFSSILNRRVFVAGVAAGVLILYACFLGDDWISVLHSPETMGNARRLVVLEDSKCLGSYDRVADTLPSWEGMSAQETWQALFHTFLPPDDVRSDFDGDGVTDHVDVEYYHQEPLFSRPTSGMVKVVSGANGKVLLARAVSCPMDAALWCGDIDGNCTDDLIVVENRSAVVFGFDRAPSTR